MDTVTMTSEVSTLGNQHITFKGTKFYYPITKPNSQNYSDFFMMSLIDLFYEG